MLSRNVAQTSFAHGDFCYSFLKVAPILRRATLAFANLESPLSDQGQQINMFRADPRFLAGLQYAGIDLVSLANNHIMDYGTEAFLDTMERLTAQGVFYVGAGTDLTRARQGRLFNLGGVKVGFLAYTQVGPGFTYTRVPQHWVATDELPGVVPARVDYLQEDLARLKQVADLVIVSFHWGQEYVHLPTATQQLLGRTALAAGADLVLGHHPHVIQGLAFGEEGVIAYSLGNFIFDQRPEVTRQGLVLEAAGDHRGIRQLRCTPIIIKDEQPQVAEGDDAKRLMGLVYTVSQDLPSASKLLK
jgi:poly-gamma-glutamate synthesis protein (capsule biosynthesis protein)